MLVKRLVLAGIGLAVILGGIALVFDTLGNEQATPAVSAGTAPSSSGTPTVDGLSPSETAKAGSPLQNDQSTGGPGGDHARDLGSDVTGEQRNLEVLPPVTASPTGLPVPSPPRALVNAPLPATASAQGKIVEGFPSQVLSFPDTTVIVFTAVSSSGDTLQATAEGIVEVTAEKVTGHFQQVLLSAGFRSEEAPAAVGQQALRLTRGNDSVSVTLSTTGTGSTRFSLLGNFHTEAGR